VPYVVWPPATFAAPQSPLTLCIVGDDALGGVIEREGPIHISNVMLLDAKGERTRVRIERGEHGERVRVAKSSGTRLD